MKKVFFSFYLLVILVSLFFVYVCGPVLSMLYQPFLQEDNIEYYRKLARGAFYIMEQDLLQLTQQQWVDRIEALRPRFSYDIAITAYTDLQLDDAQKKQLREGKIVCVDDGEYLYHQVGESQMVLSKGPLSALEEEIDGNKTYLIASWWFAAILFMAMPTAIWMLLFWRKLRKISSTATAFGSGDFNARTDIGKRSALTPIAIAFNTMADRIQQLINSHKELTNAVSHELRSPIARIRFGLEMQASSSTPEKKYQYTQGLMSDVKILEELVSELLTYARFDREKPRMNFGVREAVPWLKHLLTAAVPVECRVSCQASFAVNDETSRPWFDAKYLGRAVENLVQNAIRHADEKVHLILECSGENCYIHVDDDGPGIAEVDRKRIFEPFTRLDHSRSRVTGGYGLGLAIVQRISNWHSGGVAVAESPMGGSRFTIHWPGLSNGDGPSEVSLQG